MIPVAEQFGKKMKVSPFSIIAIYLIKFYKFFVSPILGNNCRYHPTCSTYSIEAFKSYGFIKGFLLTSKRVLSCHPFGGFGYQPLEQKKILIKKLSVTEIQKARKIELYHNLNPKYSKYNEDFLNSTIHLGLFVDALLISGLTLIETKKKKNLESFQIRGMFTKKKFINNSYGSKLINYAINLIFKKFSVYLWCNARKNAVNFYKKNGFNEKGDFFLKEGIGLHMKMILENRNGKST